jgi:addiction module RelE/StbE family toxin
MKVRFTRAAQSDLAQIHAYVSQDSPTIASRFVARLVERAREIGDHPTAGRMTDESDVRVVVAPPLRYLIFYRVVEDEVQITHIRHTSRRRPGNWGRS